MMMTVWIWTYLFLTFWKVAAGTGEKITCGVAATSQQNDTRLTCYFPEDIGLSKKSIQVNRLTDNNGESTTFLDCKWRDGRPLCFVKTGLSFDRNFTKNITITIPASWTVDSDNGIYTCHILSPGLYEAVPCKFIPDQGTNLVDCKWRSEKPLCFVKSGLMVERNFTKRIAIQIPAWSFDDIENEMYSCISSDPGLYEAVPCTLLQDPDNRINV